jgi:hypothetical protein
VVRPVRDRARPGSGSRRSGLRGGRSSPGAPEPPDRRWGSPPSARRLRPASSRSDRPHGRRDRGQARSARAAVGCVEAVRPVGRRCRGSAPRGAVRPPSAGRTGWRPGRGGRGCRRCRPPRAPSDHGAHQPECCPSDRRRGLEGHRGHAAAHHPGTRRSNRHHGAAGRQGHAGAHQPGTRPSDRRRGPGHGAADHRTDWPDADQPAPDHAGRDGIRRRAHHRPAAARAVLRHAGRPASRAPPRWVPPRRDRRGPNAASTGPRRDRGPLALLRILCIAA